MAKARQNDACGSYPRSYYAATVPAVSAGAPLDDLVHADLCIVGGGYAGLGAALRAAERGLSVCLLEAGPLGWGASGRNGGQVHVGMRRDQLWLEQALGLDDARALWSLALDARAHLDELINHYGIACDYRAGHLHADHKPRYVSHSRAIAEHLRDRYDHAAIRFVDRDEMRALVATDGYHGGTLDMRGGHLHPLKLALGIAGAATAAGARLFPHSSASTIVRQRDGWRIETACGAVQAHTVLLAGGGYLKGLEPAVEARVMPINNYVATTAPMPAGATEALIRGGLAVSDSRFVIYYYRITPDGRLLFGGGETYRYQFPRDIAGFVRPHLVRIFPQLKDVPLDHAWGGTLSVTPKRLPFVRQVRPGLYNASGFSGLGVVLAPYVGRVIGDALAGDRRPFDRLAALPVPAFPGGRWLRWPTMVAAMLAFALRDRL